MISIHDFLYAFHPRKLTEFPLRPPTEAAVVISTLEDGHRWLHHWREYRRRAVFIGELYKEEREIFFSVAAHDAHSARYMARLTGSVSMELPGVRPNAASTLILPALWVSLMPVEDARGDRQVAAAGVLESLPRKPSCVVSTGPRLDVYWLLREPWILEAGTEHAAATAFFRRFQRSIRQRARRRGFAVEEQDLGQILRLPGSIDFGSEERWPVVCESLNSARYDPRDFGFAPTLPPGRPARRLPSRVERATVDPVDGANRDLVHGLERLLEPLDGKATAAEILAALADDPGNHGSLRDALRELFPRLEDGELPSALRLGCKLRQLKGQALDGVAVVEGPRGRHGVRWQIEKRL